ncbi:hypothetical protein U9M48_021829 [Paspalum notatum var. saurae]|uniref:Cell number regulator 1 n=1 Tax=Paspalum notatum var. saurae TaxID=547442 RepID=A0AAQ3TKC9_PASNO
MYPSAPPDAYNKFSSGAPPTAPPPAAYGGQQQGVSMNPSRPGTAGLRRWSTGLFHCMDDPGNCLITCLCPCITFGQIADIVDKGSCCEFISSKLPTSCHVKKLRDLADSPQQNRGCFSACIASGLIYGLICTSTLMGCMYSCGYRSRLRAQYDLEEGECPDFMVHCCCEHLALCQEYRELKNRGYDLGIEGWEANMERQRRGVAGGAVMGAPAMPLGMIR